MKQMTAPCIPAIGCELVGSIAYGFVRVHRKKIFLCRVYGDCPIFHPVLEDGSILCGPNVEFPFPLSTVETINAQDLGITELRFVNWPEINLDP